jgi:hypothetical protein
MGGPSNNLILQLGCQIHKIVAVAGDPYDEVPIVVGILPGPFKGLSVHHIEKVNIQFPSLHSKACPLTLGV